MHLTRLALTDFRSYADLSLELEPGVTTFSGPNGEGKTNLVEAVGYLATLGSHRVATDAPLVRQGAERAVLRAVVTSLHGSALVEVELNPGRANRVRLNRAQLPRPRDLLGTLRTVLFAPEDLALVKGDPGDRRKFLDDLLVANAPRYAGVRADYERVLRQRTALLKSAGAKGHLRGAARESMTATLDAWDAQLARAAAPLLSGRMRLVTQLRPLVAAAYHAVSGGPPGAGSAMAGGFRGALGFVPPEASMAGGSRGVVPPEVSMAYRCSVDGAGPGDEVASLEAATLKAMAAVRSSELDRGVCLVGPHRDELELSVGGLPARGYASHGESWSLALALRLASFDLLRQGREDPVLVLDDVFAELDAGRRDRLAALAAGAEQVLITAAVPADVPGVLTGARFSVGAGLVSRGG
ncbi:MAG TPA: DNA replication/repair protein RecF [Streptosporangiaceae bacterium]|nr:DNA replication/repair protein RecF [Streptosporangiaceae bacterium]